MRPELIVFGLAAILLALEIVLSLTDSGKKSSRPMWLRWSSIAILNISLLVLWNIGILSGPMAAVAAVLLLAEACLISIRHYDNIPAKIISFILAFTILGSVAAVMILSGTIETKWKPKPGLQSFAFEQVKTKTIAKLAAEKYKGAKALVITPERIPFLSEKETDKIIKCLKDELAGKIEVTAVEKVPVIIDEGKSFPKFDALLADKLIAAHPGCHIIISYAGLPEDYGKMSFLNAKDGPAFFLAAQYWRMEKEDLTKLLQEGCIASYVQMKPKWKTLWERNPVMPSSDEKAFQQRYSLITPDNFSGNRR